MTLVVLMIATGITSNLQECTYRKRSTQYFFNKALIDTGASNVKTSLFKALKLF